MKTKWTHSVKIDDHEITVAPLGGMHAEYTRADACRAARNTRDHFANENRGHEVTVTITREHATEPTYTTPPKVIRS